MMRATADDEVDPVDVGHDLEPGPLLAEGELYSPTGTELLPLWTERWPKSELRKVRDRGLRSFQRSHGQRPLADNEAVFSAAVIAGCIDRTLTLGTLPPIPKAQWYVTAG